MVKVHLHHGYYDHIAVLLLGEVEIRIPVSIPGTKGVERGPAHWLRGSEVQWRVLDCDSRERAGLWL